MPSNSAAAEPPAGLLPAVFGFGYDPLQSVAFGKLRMRPLMRTPYDSGTYFM